jgi:nucleotide-binding universal stress UspA family protein
VFETVIVPLDGSELSEAALPAAIGIAEKFGSKLILVRAVESTAQRLAETPALLDTPAVAAANVELIEQVTKADRDEAGAYLARVKTGIIGKTVETLVVEGLPADAIVEVARERDAGLIVMSSHGRGGLGRLVHGSVADSVLRHGSAPVLLMRPKLDP